MSKPTAPVITTNIYMNNDISLRTRALTQLVANLINQGKYVHNPIASAPKTGYNKAGSTDLSSSSSQQREEMKT